MDLVILLLVLLVIVADTVTAQQCDVVTSAPGGTIAVPTATPIFTVSSPTIYVGNPVGGSNVTVRGATLVTAAATNPDWTVGTTAPNANTYGWEDITCDLVARSGGAGAAPSFLQVNGLALYAYSFVNAGGEFLYFNMHIPHRIVPNSGFFIHAHFIPQTALGGDVTFTFKTAYANRATGSFTAAFTTTVTYTIPAGSQWAHLVAESSAQVITAAPSTSQVEVDGVIMGSITRSASDTYAGDVFLIFVDAHIQTSKFNTKSKDPPYYT